MTKCFCSYTSHILLGPAPLRCDAVSLFKSLKFAHQCFIKQWTVENKATNACGPLLYVCILGIY